MKNSIIMKLFDGLVWTATLPLALMPYKTAMKTAALGGRIFFGLWSSRREFAVDNVRRAVEQGALPKDINPEETARESFCHMGRSFVEIVRLYHGRTGRILDRIEIRGDEHYIGALKKGKGLIMITGHCGNWELMALWLAVKLGSPIGVVARAQNSPYLDRLVEKMRSGSGNTVIYKQGAVKKILREIKNGGNVGILIDQAVLAKEGCLISFLGRPALTTKLPALVARKTGTPVVPCFIAREEDGSNIVTIHPEVKLSDETDKEKAVLDDMQTLTGYIEDYIRDHPSQWLWGHRRWKRAPETFPD